MEYQAVRPAASWARHAAVTNTLALLRRKSVLIAVTLQLWVAGSQFDITVSKALTEAGLWAGQYWWEVDRLTEEVRDSARREKRWALGLRSYDTAEAAYEAAVQAVERGIGSPAAEQAAGASTEVTAQSA